MGIYYLLMSDWDNSDFEENIETDNIESKFKEKEMNKKVFIEELLKDKTNFVDNPYKKKELHDDMKAIRDADAKYKLLKDK